MNNACFYILEESFLIRSTLASVIAEQGGMVRIIPDGYESARQFLVNNPPECLLVNTSFLKDDDFSSLIRSCLKNGKSKLMVISHKNDDGLPAEFLMHESIPVSISKDTLIEKISVHIKEKQDNSGQKELSEREKDILRCVALGLTNKEIAEKLFISVHTVITHRKNIVGKLGIKTVSGLTIYAILNNIVSTSDIEL